VSQCQCSPSARPFSSNFDGSQLNLTNTVRDAAKIQCKTNDREADHAHAMEAPILGSERYGRADGADLVTSGKVSVGVARTLLHNLIWVPPRAIGRAAPHTWSTQYNTQSIHPRGGKGDRCRVRVYCTVCVKVHTILLIAL